MKCPVMKITAFLLFLHQILQEIQWVNKSFQVKNTDKAKFFDNITLLVKKYGNKLMLASHNINVLTCNVEDYLDSKLYLSYKLKTKISELKHECKSIDEEK